MVTTSTGPLTSEANVKTYFKCGRDKQYGEKACRMPRDLAVHPIEKCGGSEVLKWYDWWPGNAFGQPSLKEQAGTGYAHPLAIRLDIAKHGVLIAGGGLNGDPSLDVGAQKSQLLLPLFKTICNLTTATHRPHLMYIGRPAQGVLKPTQYLRTQDNLHVIRFDTAMRRFAQHLGVEFFNNL